MSSRPEGTVLMEKLVSLCRRRGFDGIASTMAFVNIFVTIALFGLSRPFALWTNVLMVVFGGGGAIAA